MDDQNVRKLVFDTLDDAVSIWLNYDIEDSDEGNFVQRAVQNGIVDKDELVEHFMFRILNL